MQALRASLPDLGDYELVEWGDHCPDEHLDAYCAMRTQMDADVPVDDLDIEPTVFDADRVRTSEERLARSFVQLHVAARRRADGVFGGFSIVVLPKGEPLAWQLDTLVMPEHRGHKLGLLMKLSTLDRIHARASWPHRDAHLVRPVERADAGDQQALRLPRGRAHARHAAPAGMTSWAVPATEPSTSVHWSSPEFRAELAAWLDEQADVIGAVDGLEATKHRSWSTVWRVEADAGIFWAKQNCRLQSFEAALVADLVRLSPRDVVPVAAFDRDRGLLLTPDQGAVLEEHADVTDPAGVATARDRSPESSSATSYPTSTSSSTATVSLCCAPRTPRRTSPAASTPTPPCRRPTRAVSTPTSPVGCSSTCQ